jgi:SAM-dependent methyltransferase
MSNDKEASVAVLQTQRDAERGYENFFTQKWEDEYFEHCQKDLNVDYVYLYQDYLAKKLLFARCYPDKTDSEIIDIGSRFETALFFSHFANVTYLEARRLPNEKVHLPHIPTFNYLCGEAQDIPCADNSYDIVTSLHALEHFGLGRYGDALDYYGDQKGLNEFNRILKPGGSLLLSVPVGASPVLEFNRQRKYTPHVVNTMLEQSGFKIIKKYYIIPWFEEENSEGGWSKKAITENAGIFERVIGHNPKANAAYFVMALKTGDEDR